MSEVRVDPFSGARTLLPGGAGPGAYASRQLHQAGEADLAAVPLPAGDPEAWRAAMREHGARDDVAALHLHATRDGAQLLVLGFVPHALARERDRFGAYAAVTHGADLLQDLVQEEVKLGDRLVAYDGEAVLLTAFAPRAPHQLLLAPRVPRARFEDDGPLGAALLADGLRRLDAVTRGAAYDLWVRTAPRGDGPFCWRVDVVPRAGDPTERGTDVAVVGVAPERAAAELRAA